MQLVSWQLKGYQILRVLWAGGLWTAGVLIVPSLFQALDRAQAVVAAVAVFRVVGVAGLFCMSGLLLLHRYVKPPKSVLISLLLALCASLLLNFAVVPMLIANQSAAEKQPFWHMAATGLYVLQMLFAAKVSLHTLRTQS